MSRRAPVSEPDADGWDSPPAPQVRTVEKAKSTETDKVREAMRGIQWSTPQGTKTMRAGDHQAMQDMYAVRVNGGKFEIVGKVAAAAAIGADSCTKF